MELLVFTTVVVVVMCVLAFVVVRQYKSGNKHNK